MVQSQHSKMTEFCFKKNTIQNKTKKKLNAHCTVITKEECVRIEFWSRKTKRKENAFDRLLANEK